MQFVINGMKYETDNMEMVAEVKKWYKVDTILTRALYPGEEMGREYACQLWKSKKGNWLLTHEEDYGMKYGQAIKEEEAKNLLMRYATGIYENYMENCQKHKDKAKPGCEVGNQNNRVGT